MATNDGLVLRGMVAAYREFVSRKDGRVYRFSALQRAEIAEISSLWSPGLRAN